MRSVRYTKLMEGLKHLKQGQSLKYEIQINADTRYNVEMQIWKQNNFQNIEKGPLVIQLLEQFKEWVELPPEMMGKKSNQICLSKSRNYCIKNISTEDFETFEKIFDKYVPFKQKEKSLLVPIYGVVNLYSALQSKSKWKDSFIFMPNLINKNAVIFDIKGHCDSRFVDESDFKDFSFGKDENFIKSKYLELIHNMPSDIRQQIFATLNINVQFLKQCGVIDYSLLLIFIEGPEAKQSKSAIKINEVYWLELQIIDFFQTFNERKKLENKFKTIFFRQISCVDPATYGKRLLDFMHKVFLPK